MLKYCFFIFLIIISTATNAQQSGRVESFLASIKDTALNSSDIRGIIERATFSIRKPLNAEEFSILKVPFKKRIDAGNDKIGYYVFEQDYYNSTQEIGKALVSADEFMRWAKSMKDTAMLSQAYALFSGTYASYNMPKERLENERKAFYLVNKNSDYSKEDIFIMGRYSWVLTQVGWQIKDTILMDSAAFFLDKTTQFFLKTDDIGSLVNSANIYCMTLARLKRYPEVIKTSCKIIESIENLPATQDKTEIEGRQIGLSTFYRWIGNSYSRTNQKDSAFYYLLLPDYFSPTQLTDYIYYPKNGKYINWDIWIDIIQAHVNFKQYKEAADLLSPVVFDKNNKLAKFIQDYLYEISAPIFEKAGKKDEAITCYAQAKMINDTLQKTEAKLIEEEKYTSTRLQIEAVKEAAELLNEKTKLEAQKELEKQNMVRNGFMGGFAVVLIFASVFFTQRNQIKKGKKLSDELLLNILPAELAEELKAKGSAEAQMIDEVTVLFTDFKGFTALSEKLTPKELVHDLNDCFSAFDRIMEKYGMEKIKTIGDAYMAAGGLPTVNNTHATDALKAAIEIRDFIAKGKKQKLAAGLPYFEIRIGMHTGPVVAGIVGVKKFAYDIWGDTVNTASRMESSGEAGMINISETTYTLVKDTFKCNYRGEIEAKGKGKVKMYFVEDSI